MPDIMTADQRSERMRRIRSRDTAPERTVRGMICKIGVRYRLHAKGLPGCPDLVFHSRQRAIFINGCFWHFHRKCRAGRLPASRIDYWKPKLERNRARDECNIRRLRRDGWKVLTIWECQIKDIDRLRKRLLSFLRLGNC